MLQLSSDLMGEKEIDIDLLEFVTSPPSVQKHSPEMWVDVYHHICRKNHRFLELREDGPYCKKCGGGADMAHLVKHESCCWSGDDADPLLRAMLQALRDSTNTTYPLKDSPTK